MFKAIAKAVKLDDISHRPCLTLDESFGVRYEVLGRRWLLLCVFIKTDTLSYRFSSLFHWITFLGNACFNARLELHSLDETLLESHTCLL